MQFDHGRWLASPTDLANFLACPHKTSLDRLVAGGKLDRPAWEDPIAEQLRRRGEAHERQYVARLASQGLAIVDLGGVERPDRRAKTLAAMRAGADVIVQAALQNDQWTGFADVLRKNCRAVGVGRLVIRSARHEARTRDARRHDPST